MDKKIIAALLACAAGFAVFFSLALWVAKGSPGPAHGSGVSNGRKVAYRDDSAAVSDTGADVTGTSDQAVPAWSASDQAFVRVSDHAPDIRVNLKYADRHNFTGKRIYDFRDAWLRCGTVKKLIKAQKALEAYGMGLMIWDAFRPAEAQEVLWTVCPNPLYVTDPDKGCSDHLRGNAVDVTLVDADGIELLMPTEFDNFTRLADRDYSDIDNAFAVENVKLLEKVMKQSGFKSSPEEWWHFTDSKSYEPAPTFVPAS